MNKKETNNMNMKQRKFSQSARAEEHAKVIRLWKSGVSVSEIAKTVGKTRATVYAWLDKDEDRLDQKDSRNRHLISDRERLQIIETYILLKAPSMVVLSERLALYFHIHRSPHQLRRYIEKWGLKDYRATPLYDEIVKDRISGGVSRRKPRGDA